MVDGTFGAGGYSRAFLATGAKVVAFDRDPSARRVRRRACAISGRFRLVEAASRRWPRSWATASADGVALDLGVSSMQLDEADRGFSFMRDGPLDMRMGGDGPTAADLVNTLEQAELARIFCVYGEERESAPHRRGHRAPPRPSSPSPAPWTWPRSVEQAAGRPPRAKTHPATRAFQGPAHRGERRARRAARPASSPPSAC